MFSCSSDGESFTIQSYGSGNTDCSGDTADFTTTIYADSSDYNFKCDGNKCLLSIQETYYEDGNSDCSDSDDTSITNYMYVPGYCYGTYTGYTFECSSTGYIDNTYSDEYECTNLLGSDEFDDLTCVTSTTNGISSSTRTEVLRCYSKAAKIPLASVILFNLCIILSFL